MSSEKNEKDNELVYWGEFGTTAAKKEQKAFSFMIEEVAQKKSRYDDEPRPSSKKKRK